MNFSCGRFQQLITFEKELCRHPEISNNEHATVEKISDKYGLEKNNG
jgi:metal-dependent amidase/aminoacylase/carboxypeptidase family protein